MILILDWFDKSHCMLHREDPVPSIGGSALENEASGPKEIGWLYCPYYEMPLLWESSLFEEFLETIPIYSKSNLQMIKPILKL